jgi:hypothetical protein
LLSVEYRGLERRWCWKQFKFRFAGSKSWRLSWSRLEQESLSHSSQRHHHVLFNCNAIETTIQLPFNILGPVSSQPILSAVYLNPRPLNLLQHGLVRDLLFILVSGRRPGPCGSDSTTFQVLVRCAMLI